MRNLELFFKTQMLTTLSADVLYFLTTYLNNKDVIVAIKVCKLLHEICQKRIEERIASRSIEKTKKGFRDAPHRIIVFDNLRYPGPPSSFIIEVPRNKRLSKEELEIAIIQQHNTNEFIIQTKVDESKLPKFLSIVRKPIAPAIDVVVRVNLKN
jgi:hypothetical protein